jgi:uncharacterized protein (DUF1015 family)
MSIVKPFRGLRARPELTSKVACPPYDVLSSKEARQMALGNPISFLHVNKSEIDFDDKVNPYSDEVYRKAADNLKKFEKDAVMIRDSKPCFYLYRLTMDGRRQTGLVVLSSVDEYDAGKIKKHEHTRPEKVDDRANHILTVNAQVGPIFSTFKQNKEIDNIFNKIQSSAPDVDFISDDKIRHELWVVSDDKIISEIESAFGKLPFIYIADGHHRSEAASEVRRRLKEKNKSHTGKEIYNYFLNVIFPHNQLHIMPYNRVVRDLNGLNVESLLKKASEKFEISPSNSPVEPKKPRTFGLYCDKKWYKISSRPESFDADHPTRSLDSSILSENLLNPILGIINLRTDKRIDFIGGIRGIGELVRLVDSGDFKIAFSLYPTTIEQLMNVADRGEVMPPKSTWFEPKLRDGMVVNILND